MTRAADRIPNDAEIAEISAAHFVQTALKPADLLFVFGTRENVGARIAEAVRLWRDGFCRWMIVSGGITPGDDASECAIIKTEMVASGVPADIILEEHRAMNTGENVIFSLPVIDARIGLTDIYGVICLGSICTSRRYPMTLQRHWPAVDKMLVTINPFGTPVAQWHTDPVFRTRVLREWDKIAPYLEKRFIAQWPV